MLKNTDLRIGNYIKTGNCIRRVFVADLISEFVLAEGVLLTMPILERLGFKAHGSKLLDRYYERDGFAITNEGAVCKMNGREIGAVLCYNVMHLHRLQNIWYTLTGTELVLQSAFRPAQGNYI